MTDSPKIPESVPELIDALGGPSAVAPKLRVKGPSTVSEMKRSGSIDVRHWPALIKLAKSAGVPGVTNDLLVHMHTKESEAAGAPA